MANLTQAEIEDMKKKVQKEVGCIMRTYYLKKHATIDNNDVLVLPFLNGIFKNNPEDEAIEKLQKLHDKLKVYEEHFKDELLLINKTINDI